MTGDESRLARRWAARRVATGLEPAPTPPTNAVVLPGALQLLSDYEDALFAYARHSLVPSKEAAAEAAHLVEAVRLHADVRRLRLEILDLMEGSHGICD